MASFQHPGFGERLSAAATAKQAVLERFRAKMGANDPELIKKQEERLAIAQARDARLSARKAEREAREAAERAALEAREAAERAEREEREAREHAEAVAWKAALEEEKKAQRDARYAARKARKLERLNSPFGKFGRR
jgi:cell division protein FtsN